MQRQDTVWQAAELVRTFVDDIRGGVPYAADQIEMLLRIVAADGRPVRRFVDLGCGSGVVARAVLAQHPDAQAVLVDFSEPMLAAAHTSLAAHQPAPRIASADLTDAAWTQSVGDLAPFDLIVSGYAIHHLPHARKQALYAEVFRLLDAGGWFLNVEHVASHSPWIESVCNGLMIDSLFAFHQRRGGTKTRQQVANEFVHRPDKEANILAPVEDQCAWLRRIGFQDVDCFFKVFELAVFGGRKPASGGANP
jgi:ubiquinone/menaquinone biosynthesis C-methylase UbiE